MNLESFIKAANYVPVLLKNEISTGDRIIVNTENSSYELMALDSGKFSVSGGYFERHQTEPVKTTISGCGLGGSIMKFDAIAVYGLCLEFGNRIITSKIMAFAAFKAFQLN